jgi:hypothetical protein
MLNIDSKVLNYVLFGLIIAIIVVIIMRAIRNDDKSKESMHSIHEVNSKHRFDEIRNNFNPHCRNTEKCALNAVEDKDTVFARDIVIGRKLEQPEKEAEFEDEEIRKYQSQFLDMADRVNYSSRNELGANEKINEMVASNNNEVIGEHGKTIGEVYDELTKSQFEKEKKCKNDGCILPSSFDTITQRNYYVDNTNTSMKTMSNFYTKYETDEVSNGGFFYDNITGHDTDLPNNLLV